MFCLETTGRTSCLARPISCCVPLGDLRANGLGGAFDGFGGDVQTREQLHRLAPRSERHLTAHHGFHASHARRGFQTSDTQFGVNRVLAFGAIGAHVIRAPQLRPAPARSARSWSAIPCSGPSVRTDRESSGGPHPADRIAAVASARKPRLGAWRIAKRSRPLPDRAGPCCGAPEKQCAGSGLLRGQLLVGWPAPFFFLGRLLGLLDGPQAADLSIDLDQLARQGLELTELSDFIFRLTDGSRRGQILGNRLALDFLGELKMRAVSGVIGFGAMAHGTATAAGGTGDGTGLEIAEFGNLPEQGGSVVRPKPETGLA